MTDYYIQSAIEDSIRTNSVSTITARIDTQEWITLVNGLSAVAEDYVCITASDPASSDLAEVRKFWGIDMDGDAWRVHVHATR